MHHRTDHPVDCLATSSVVRPATSSVIRPALTVATLAITLAVSACSGGNDNGDGSDKEDQPTPAATSGAATEPSRGTASSSSSSSSPLPPIAPITPDTAAPPSRSVTEGPLVESSTWADSNYGATLKIAPTEAGRLASGFDDARTAWSEVLDQVPDADTPGMWEQFDCHWTWARILEPDKATWNVEPWRPVVDEGTMLAEGCNPGGPEV